MILNYYLSLLIVNVKPDKYMADIICMFLHCQGQGSDECRYMHVFIIASALCPIDIDANRSRPSELLKDYGGLDVCGENDVKIDMS